MTLNTSQVPSVIARVITSCTCTCARLGLAGTMIKRVRRRPAIGCMTRVALHRRGKMTRCWLWSRAAVINMTCVTHTRSIRIVNPGATNEGGSGMARAAIQIGCKVRRICLGILAFGCHSMTGVAARTGGDATMIERRRNEGTAVGRNTMTGAAV